jgi:RNA polymerase sigma-70 factor (ECF subfamily)
MQDQEIVRRVLDGDGEAYRILVDRHRGLVIGVLSRMGGGPDRAEELAQETFVRAYQGLSGFRGEARFSTWLIQIALHVARNQLKRERRQAKVVSLDELQEREGFDSDRLRDTRPGYAPDDGVERRELGERLSRALDELPPSYREVFVLKHVQEMSYEEISSITGDSVGSLKVRAHRARGILRDALRENPSEDPSGIPGENPGDHGSQASGKGGGRTPRGGAAESRG